MAQFKKVKQQRIDDLINQLADKEPEVINRYLENFQIAYEKIHKSNLKVLDTNKMFELFRNKRGCSNNEIKQVLSKLYRFLDQKLLTEKFTEIVEAIIEIDRIFDFKKVKQVFEGDDEIDSLQYISLVENAKAKYFYDINKIQKYLEKPPESEDSLPAEALQKIKSYIRESKLKKRSKSKCKQSSSETLISEKEDTNGLETDSIEIEDSSEYIRSSRDIASVQRIIEGKMEQKSIQSQKNNYQTPISNSEDQLNLKPIIKSSQINLSNQKINVNSSNNQINIIQDSIFQKNIRNVTFALSKNPEEYPLSKKVKFNESIGNHQNNQLNQKPSPSPQNAIQQIEQRKGENFQKNGIQIKQPQPQSYLQSMQTQKSLLNPPLPKTRNIFQTPTLPNFSEILSTSRNPNITQLKEKQEQINQGSKRNISSQEYQKFTSYSNQNHTQPNKHQEKLEQSKASNLQTQINHENNLTKSSIHNQFQVKNVVASNYLSSPYFTHSSLGNVNNAQQKQDPKQVNQLQKLQSQKIAGNNLQASSLNSPSTNQIIQSKQISQSNPVLQSLEKQNTIKQIAEQPVNSLKTLNIFGSNLQQQQSNSQPLFNSNLAQNHTISSKTTSINQNNNNYNYEEKVKQLPKQKPNENTQQKLNSLKTLNIFGNNLQQQSSNSQQLFNSNHAQNHTISSKTTSDNQNFNNYNHEEEVKYLPKQNITENTQQQLSLNSLTNFNTTEKLGLTTNTPSLERLDKQKNLSQTIEQPIYVSKPNNQIVIENDIHAASSNLLSLKEKTQIKIPSSATIAQGFENKINNPLKQEPEQPTPDNLKKQNITTSDIKHIPSIQLNSQNKITQNLIPPSIIPILSSTNANNNLQNKQQDSQLSLNNINIKKNLQDLDNFLLTQLQAINNKPQNQNNSQKIFASNAESSNSSQSRQVATSNGKALKPQSNFENSTDKSILNSISPKTDLVKSLNTSSNIFIPKQENLSNITIQQREQKEQSGGRSNPDSSNQMIDITNNTQQESQQRERGKSKRKNGPITIIPIDSDSEDVVEISKKQSINQSIDVDVAEIKAVEIIQNNAQKILLNELNKEDQQKLIKETQEEEKKIQTSEDKFEVQDSMTINDIKVEAVSSDIQGIERDECLNKPIPEKTLILDETTGIQIEILNFDDFERMEVPKQKKSKRQNKKEQKNKYTQINPSSENSANYTKGDSSNQQLEIEDENDEDDDGEPDSFQFFQGDSSNRNSQQIPAQQEKILTEANQEKDLEISPQNATSGANDQLKTVQEQEQKEYDQQQQHLKSTDHQQPPLSPHHSIQQNNENMNLNMNENEGSLELQQLEILFPSIFDPHPLDFELHQTLEETTLDQLNKDLLTGESTLDDEQDKENEEGKQADQDLFSKEKVVEFQERSPPTQALQFQSDLIEDNIPFTEQNRQILADLVKGGTQALESGGSFIPLSLLQLIWNTGVAFQESRKLNL